MTPLAERARVSLLRSHGVQVLQGRAEQEELELLRESREKCGCSCVGDCEPETCECALNGIECQVERDGFPCACGPACANPEGRREFDETEVSSSLVVKRNPNLASGEPALHQHDDDGPRGDGPDGQQPGEPHQYRHRNLLKLPLKESHG